MFRPFLFVSGPPPANSGECFGHFGGIPLLNPQFEGDPSWGQFGRLGKHMLWKIDVDVRMEVLSPKLE